MYIPKTQASFAITDSPKEKGSNSSSVPCLFSLYLSNSSPPSFCSISSTIHQTQRKISSIAKLRSTELPLFLLPLHTSLPPKKRILPSKTTFLIFLLNAVRCIQKLLLYAPKPPFSIIASPTLIIIRSHHTDSIPIQCNRHADLSVQHLTPETTKLPMQK